METEMSTSQLLQDGDFSNLSPQSVPSYTSTTIVSAPTTVGSWSVDTGNIEILPQNRPVLQPYTSQLPPDNNRYIICLNRTVAGSISQRLVLPRAGTVFVDFYFGRRPTAGRTGDGFFSVDVLRDAAQLGTRDKPVYGELIDLDGSSPVWRSHQTRMAFERGGTGYLRFLGAADTAGMVYGGAMITSVVLRYPYDVVAKLTTPSSNAVSADANQSFPEMIFSFTENNPDPNLTANANNALPSSNVTFQLRNGQSGIRFANSVNYSTTTDAYGNATIPAGTLMAGPYGGVSDQLLASMGSESAGVVAALGVTGPSQPTGGNYRLVWQGANPFPIPQNGTANAVFQLQTTDGTPVVGVNVALGIGNPGGTNVQFVGGGTNYLNPTDGAGNISAPMTAGSVTGDATVVAVTTTSPVVTSPVIDVRITQATQQYQLVWKGGANPLSIPQNGTATAVFQLQTLSGTPVPGMAVILTTLDSGGTNLLFTGGVSRYGGNTDPSGNISVTMLAGNVPGTASVVAQLIADPTVTQTENVQITQAAQQYQLVWTGGANPLLISQGGTARAMFQLQIKGTTTPAPGVRILLTISNTAGTGLQFSDSGKPTYSNTTDPSGNISAAMTAGYVAGQASVTAALQSDASVSLVEPVQITAPTPPATMKYQLSWENTSPTLVILQNQQGQASFRVKSVGTLIPTAGQAVQLDLTGNLGLIFANGRTRYTGATDPTGILNAQVQAGAASGLATVVASMPTGEATPLTAPIMVTAVTPADAASAAPRPKTGKHDRER
jgi:hypothetical protein